MKKITLSISLFCAILILVGCGSNTKGTPKFQINGIDVPAVLQNADINALSEDRVVTVNALDTVTVEDVSEFTVEKREWDFGDGVRRISKSNIARFVPEKFGFFKITLYVNGDKQTETKVLHVLPFEAKPEEPIVANSAPRPKRVTKYRPPTRVDEPIILISEPVTPTYIPPAAPVKKARMSSVAGYKLSSSTDCGQYEQSNFTVTLSPKEDCELGSVYLWTNNEGKVNITLKGDGKTESTTEALTNGKNQISLDDINMLMKAGQTYTLSFSAKGDGGSAPDFKNVKSCSPSDFNNNVLSMTNNGYLFDLKFSYYH